MTPRVLFVDDEGAVLRALSRQLNIDFDLSTAHSGKEALVLIENSPRFDVVVTDFSMPGMNGLDLIERAVAMAPTTRFIVLTGNGDEETISRAEAMETVYTVLRKPCCTETLIDCIRDAAGMAKAEA